MSLPRIKTRMLALASLAILALTSIIYTGCTKGITGNQYVNSVPSVRFVNVPPDGSSFSANPIVSWVGTDVDGRIVQFQYTVALVSQITAAIPGQPTTAEALSHAAGIPAGDWTIREVTLDDPANKDTVRMTADFSNPVNNIVQQLVFLRALDDQGATSDVVYRTFGRNDHYPQTGLNPFVSPYVNVKQQRFGLGGIPVIWSGTDEVDYPGDELAPLEFEWRLYGPFTQDESLMIIDSFTVPLLVTAERSYSIGETLIDTLFDFTRADTHFDTTVVPPTIDSITVHIDRIFNIPVELANGALLEEAGGQFDTIVDIERVDSSFYKYDVSPGSLDSTKRNRLVESSLNPLTESPWVLDRSELFFDVFKNDPHVTEGTPADTTREMSFLFWVRARDDAFVPDPTPTFSMFTVIFPKHERDLMIVDFGKLTVFQNINGNYNPPCAINNVTGGFEDGVDTAKTSFSRHLTEWLPGFVGVDNLAGFDTTTFDPCGEDTGAFPPGSRPCDGTEFLPKNSSPDYMLGAGLPANFTPWRPGLRDILKHKVVIFYKEQLQSALPVKSGTIGEIWLIEGVLSGVNFWTMSRGTFQPTKFSADTVIVYGVQNQAVPEVYSNVFGVEGGAWQGWYGMNVTRQSIANPRTPVRNEDFIGAVPVEGLSSSEYPELVVDTARLRQKLRWSDKDLCGRIFKHYPYLDTVGALPEVGFTIPRTILGTESLYLYRSRFGEAKYPFFDLPFNDYQGTVVAVRRDAGFFRASHWCFTPLVMDPDAFQGVFNTMMDWLFAAPWGGPSYGTAGRRLPMSDELDYTSEATRLAQIAEKRRRSQRFEIMGGQRFIKNQFEYDAKYRQWKTAQRALEVSDGATF